MKCDSEIYAERDGIEVQHYMKYERKHTRYMVPCAKCGRIVPRGRYDPEKIYLCDYCKKVQAIKQKAVFEDAYSYIRTPKEQQFDKAVEKLRAIAPDVKLDKDIKIAETRAEKYGSIPEAMAAIVLLYSGYVIIPQQRVGTLTLDFCLPKDKIVIEVDGSLYHSSREKSLRRDARIQAMLGHDWEIIHLPAEGIEKNPFQIPKAISETLQHRGKGKGLK